jgi:hypothetical protein
MVHWGGLAQNVILRGPFAVLRINSATKNLGWGFDMPQDSPLPQTLHSAQGDMLSLDFLGKAHRSMMGSQIQK